MGHVEAWQLRVVQELAAEHGVLWHHCRDGRLCEGSRGLPDLLLVGPGGLLVAELKARTGLTSAQTTWTWTLRAAGVDIVTWLPSHFHDGTVEARIAALGRR